ncbi:MAG: hypothetical protein JST84_26025 [Acidobacteria bacterium]|nr:hypothetical protein [Acidobacteriota bacterium]
MLEKLADKNFLDPEIAWAGNCHTCQQLISLAAENCPYCGIKIEMDDIFVSSVNHVLLTQAISSANAIRTYDGGVYIFLAVSVMRFLIDVMSYTFPLWFAIATSIVWLAPLFLIGKWYQRHGKWDSDDAEYLFVQKELERSFLLWLVLHLFNGILIWISQQRPIT